MSLKDLLEKMKLVEFEDAEPAAPAAGAPKAPPTSAPPPPPRRAGATATSGPRPSLEEIVKGATAAPPKVDEAALARQAAAPAGGGLPDAPDFPGIYKASGVADPAHGFSAYKVLEMLSSSDFAALEPRAKAAALQGFLKFNPSGPVAIADVIQDAVKRDQALDAFEEFLRKKLDARRAELEKDSQRLQAEIDELTRKNREAIEANRQALETEKERFATWQARKRIEERKLHDAVAPFVEQNPVTLGASSAAPAAGTSEPSTT
jgi:hypothetical protein